jgi:hypothetical protein
MAGEGARSEPWRHLGADQVEEVGAEVVEEESSHVPSDADVKAAVAEDSALNQTVKMGAMNLDVGEAQVAEVGEMKWASMGNAIGCADSSLYHIPTVGARQGKHERPVVGPNVRELVQAKAYAMACRLAVARMQAVRVGILQDAEKWSVVHRSLKVRLAYQCNHNPGAQVYVKA